MRRWMSGWIGLCLGSLLAASDAPAQQGETRIALIIANTDYVSGQLIDLPGAQRDAATISAALERAGFSRRNIVTERNLGIADMRRAFSSFGARLTALGQDGLGFIYYAGHGIADSDGEGARNYIIPTDANLNSAFDYPNAAYSVSGLLDGLNRTRARTVVVVLDACRRTPLRGDRGMVPEIVPRNMLVAYSASPGQAASDDGTYARRLAEELVRPNADITQVFTQVQYRVSADSRGSQTPRVDIGLTAPVVFVAVSAPTSVTTAPATTPQRTTAPPPAAVAINSTNPETGRDQNLLIDDATLRSIALSAWSQERQRTPLWNNRAAQQRLERVGNRIVSAAGRGDQAWEFALLDSPYRYAFVLPGNKVGFSRGLMEMMSLDDYIAALLGHEVGHLVGRHAAERYSLELRVSLGARPPVNRQVAMAALGMGTQGGIVVPFSREQELEADILGLNYMHSAGYDVRQVIALWTEMNGVYGLPEMRSAQPDLGTRIPRIRTYINQHGWGPA